MSEAKSDPTVALTIQLLEWLAKQPRTHSEIMDAWRTTCPRLSIWEDACIEGLVDKDTNSEPSYFPSRKGHQLLGSTLPPQIKRGN
jgi:hypothetical protein